MTSYSLPAHKALTARFHKDGRNYSHLENQDKLKLQSLVFGSRIAKRIVRGLRVAAVALSYKHKNLQLACEILRDSKNMILKSVISAINIKLLFVSLETT
jgi:hypothetical protein